MPKSHVQHKPGDRTCDVCGQSECDPLFQHTVTGFLYCDGCRRLFPDLEDLVRVV